MANNLPKPPTIEGEGLEKWLTDRDIDYQRFVVLVGTDPDDPIASKRRLAKEFKKAESTITRWLAQMKREMK